MKSSDARIALITGANKGIGFEIARQLGKKGFTVLIGARDATRGKQATESLQSESIDAYFLEIDVTIQSTIDKAAAIINSKFGKLDVLVNNAGIFIDKKPPSQLEQEVLRKTFDTNVFGVIAVTQAVLPLLRKSASARIVNLSSGLGSLALTTNLEHEYSKYLLLAYNTSKTALNQITVQFANELRGEGIKVNAADPGYVATDLNDHNGTRTVQQGATVAVRLATLDSNGPTGGFFDEDGSVEW
jgi:NAD(P)-dependent dehydrogenase (short-subunit alcohol dehydrogenase family)